MSRSGLVYLSGGVGGARLAHGLKQVLAPEELTCIVNTGDDLVHWGLHVSPDLDTMMYTLADVADVARGWGLADETFAALAGIQRYGGDAWFALGDKDLATHLMRSEWLRAGISLTEVTRRLSRALDVTVPLLPMTDAPCETMIDTDQGTLGFQHWLVGERALPAVRRVWFRGATEATGDVLAALRDARLVVIGPSNPYVSIDPILALKEVRQLLARVPVLAVSPIVHGHAIKGPLAGMLETLGQTSASARSIALHYGELLHAFVVERGDETHLGLGNTAVLGTDTVMHGRAESRALAVRVLQFARELGHWS